ncbi:MAG TPA: hypothetical protein VMU19_01055 [Bryobacteraceae bacterium]|nr:hypothetical protein [Bryobacteraceae bacterium]
MLLGLLIAIAPFYWWSNAAIRRRYGSVRASEEERRRMQRHPVILALLGGLALAIILAKFGALGSDAHTSDFWVPAAVLIAILTTILDTTNLPSRRIVWGIGLGALLGAGPVLIEVAQGAAVFALIGAVWLSVSIFDFLLLRRIFAEISAAQPAATGEAAESHG